MLKKFRKQNGLLLAGDESLSLENRLFLSAIIIGLFVSLLGTIVSILLSSSLPTIIVSGALFIILLIIYYFVRFKRMFRPFVLPLIMVSFIGISTIWILDGGINGSDLMIGFVIFILALIIVPDKTRKYLLILFTTLVITIYLIQLYRPDLVTGFPTEKARWTDSIVTAVYCSALFFLIIQFLLRNYTVERRRAEENEKKLRALSENSQDRITRYDRQHRYTYINKAGLDVIGINSAFALGKTPGEIGIYDKEQSEMLDAAIEKVFTSKQSLTEQYSLKILDGKAYYDLRLFPEFNDNDEVTSILSVSRDITIIKQTELKLLQLNADKDLFISILAHDLRNPFNSILGLSSLLLEDIQTMDRFTIEKYIEMINNTSRKTFDLLEDLLLWKRSQLGKLEFKPRLTDFVKTCNETLEAMRVNALLKKIKINWATEGNVSIEADEDMLKVVLRNLVSNAIKFTNPGGHIFINRELTGSALTVTVSDNGVGIAADRISSLFDISKISTTPGTSEEKGTGLGLLLCKEFVERHGGRIWVESVEGKGSDFKFTIPIGQSEKQVAVG